jgi:glycosyltransferase involved in cell wall biosynthesis
MGTERIELSPNANYEAGQLNTYEKSERDQGVFIIMIDKSTIKSKIGLVISPFLLPAGVVPLNNFIDILAKFFSQIFLIAGENGCNLNKSNLITISVECSNKNAKMFIISCIKMSYVIYKLSNINRWCFFMGERVMLIPIIASKLMGKRIIYISSGSLIKIKLYKPNARSFLVNNFFEPLILRAADKIVIYSERLMDDKSLKKYEDKIIIAREHFIDFEKFKLMIPFEKRENLIGFIGRLSREKGALNFLKAIPLITRSCPNVKIFVAGESNLGKYLENEIEALSKMKELKQRFTISGWIDHDDLPDYLNQLKLLVVPSYTEGLPNIMLESMACGTPVLVSPVGAIPDVIVNGKNGFILVDNSPHCISKSVIKILISPDLIEVSECSQEYVQNNFNYDSAVHSCQKIFED